MSFTWHMQEKNSKHIHKTNSIEKLMCAYAKPFYTGSFHFVKLDIETNKTGEQEGKKQSNELQRIRT